MAVFRASSVLQLLLHDIPFQMQITTADQLVFFVLPWLFVLPWQLWGTVLTGLTPTNNIISNFWFGFWLENKSSFRSFYFLIYCSKKRVYIVRKTKVRNHRRVASSPSAKFQFLLKPMSVTNTAFVGEGKVMIIAAWTHLKGVGWGGEVFFYEKGEVWTVSGRKITHNSFNKTTLNVD